MQKIYGVKTPHPLLNNMNLREIILLILLTFSLIVYISCDNNREHKRQHNYVNVDLGSKKLNIPQPISLKMYDEILKYSKKYKVPKYIAFNIAYMETKYRGPFHFKYKHNLSSGAGAVGPMQIMPSTANYIHDEPISTHNLKNDVQLNVKISMKLLSTLYKKYGDWKLVCGCYNTGRPMVNSYALFCVNNKDYRKNWNQINS